MKASICWTATSPPFATDFAADAFAASSARPAGASARATAASAAAVRTGERGEPSIGADPPRNCDAAQSNAGALLCLWLEHGPEPHGRARARRAHVLRRS